MNREKKPHKTTEELLQSLQIPAASEDLAARIAFAARMSQYAVQAGERNLLLIFTLPRTLLTCIICLFLGAMLGWKGFDYAAPPHPAPAYPQQVASSDIWYDKGDMW